MRLSNRVVLFAGFVAIAGCSSSSSGPVCDPNPESLVRAQSLTTNGKTINAITLNGISLNSLSSNGVGLNSLTFNGISLNGLTLNGVHLNSLTVNGTELSGVAADGHTIAGADLVGATLTGVLSDGSTIDLVVVNRTTTNGVAYYTLHANGQPLCASDGGGIFVAGAWDATGARHDTLTVGGHTVGASYSCQNGAIGKCVVWGYAPSTVGADLHQSCTRMVRADYCGTGVSFTKNGTPIDIFDARGIQQPTTGDASLLFEAAWTTSGAACVSRTRYDARTPSGAEVMPSCWASLPKCASWGEAQASGAILGNASRLEARSVCE